MNAMLSSITKQCLKHLKTQCCQKLVSLFLRFNKCCGAIIPNLKGSINRIYAFYVENIIKLRYIFSKFSWGRSMALDSTAWKYAGSISPPERLLPWVSSPPPSPYIHHCSCLPTFIILNSLGGQLHCFLAVWHFGKAFCTCSWTHFSN